MKLKVGDRVKFLNDVGGGKITNIIDKYTVMVETTDGFDFPYPIVELIIDEPEKSDNFFNKTVQKQQIEEKTKSIDDIILEETSDTTSKDNEEVNIYLSFVPKNQDNLTGSDQEINLVNDSNWSLMYVYQIKKGNGYESFPGFLQPNYIEHLKTVSMQELSEISEIVLNIIFFRKGIYDSKEPVYKTVKLNHSRFYKTKSYEKNDFFELKNFSIPVLEENPLAEALNRLDKNEMVNIVKQKETQNKNANKPKNFKKVPKNDIVEIDLHIHELLDDTSGMEAKEMLDYQMDKFNEEYEKAKKTHHVKKIVFIHGKGNGKLKTEIRLFLDRNRIIYQDASFQKYGFGATLVFV